MGKDMAGIGKPESIGPAISLSSKRGEQDERPNQISHDDALRRLLTVGGFPEPFCVYPYTSASERSIQKPSKVYFFDNADLIDNGDAGTGEVLN